MQLQEDDEETLYGVYNINKGYAVFREVTIIDENEEYCIVESNNIVWSCRIRLYCSESG